MKTTVVEADITRITAKFIFSYMKEVLHTVDQVSWVTSFLP